MSNHSTRLVVGIFSAFAVALAAIAVGLYLTTSHGAPEHDAMEAVQLGHVHGLGINPADGDLYVASHSGVFRLQGDESVRLADRWQDTMGFAVVGPDQFLGSGHPDVRETDLPSHLGLIKSTDAAESWQAVSLSGAADLHALEPTEQTLYAYDAASGSLVATDDRRSWRVLDERPLIDLAAAGGQLFATTETGQLLRYNDAGGAPTAMVAAPVLAFIDGTPDEGLLGLAPEGQLYASTDGSSWTEAGQVDGVAAAVDAAADEWHVATDQGIYRSTDQGRTWKPIIEAAS